MKSSQTAHTAVAKAAKDWAGAWYEENAKDNRLYAGVLQQLFSGQNDFVEKCWGHFVPVARAALAKALSDPRVPEKTKQDIYDALLLDKMLPRVGHSVQSLIDAVPASLTKH